ncbi:MAG: cobalamin-dependent protein [bacterium]
MREKKAVILVNIVRKTDDRGNYPPLSTAFLKAYADKHENIREHYDISLFTASFEGFKPDELLKEVRDKMPSVIGLSCYMWNLKQYMDVLPEIKKIARDAIVITGGPEAHPALLDTSPEMDAIAVGEGEALFKELLARLLNGEPWQHTLGIAFRRGDGIHINPPQKLLESLDEIPSPYKTGILSPTPIMHFEYSRGCTNNCSYCVDAKDPYRHMSIGRIEEEILFCIENKAHLGLSAGSYLNFKDFGAQTLRLLKKYRDMGHDISISDTLCIDANNDDEEFFNLLDDIVPDKSKLALTVGIQCTHPETLKINRRITKMENISNVFTKWNFCNMTQLIIGLPGDNIFRVAHTLAESAKLSPQLVQTFNLSVIPNTYLFENKEKFDIKANLMPPHELYSMNGQDEKDIKKTQMMAHSFSMEYNCSRHLK